MSCDQVFLGCKREPVYVPVHTIAELYSEPLPAAGVLGENMVIPTFLGDDVSKFWILNGSVLVLCVLVFYIIIVWLKRKRLM